MWNADQYLRFKKERDRPFFDLLAQVCCVDPRVIADLGCGTGHHTRWLADRWQAARVVGVDHSPEMLAKARTLVIPGRLEFVEADLTTWSMHSPIDLLVSNSALHWVENHADLLLALTRLLAPGGTMAVQLPNRFQTASQHAIEKSMADPRWASRLADVGLHRRSVMPLETYVRRLLELGYVVNAWETTYYHVLTGPSPVLEWFKGTGLRPLLERLHPEERAEFLDDLSHRLAEIHPAHDGVTLFPFPRLFFVAQRSF